MHDVTFLDDTTYFCTIFGPSRSSPGLISSSGLAVSTKALTIAKKYPFWQVLCAYDTDKT